MPSLMNRRGKMRYRAAVMVQGRRKTKWFPDDSKKTYRDAVMWEKEQAEVIRKELETIRTDFLSIKRWGTQYMTYIQQHFTSKTYQEKRAAFVRFGLHQGVTPEMCVRGVDRFLCAEFFNSQLPQRTGNAVNKDRKNLAAAWQWGRDNLRGWPLGENPFLAVPRKAETRHPRYMPPEADFWKVFDYVAGKADGDEEYLQNRVMLLAYLHLAARRTELFKATWSDVDFAQGRIRLWTRKRRDGGLECDWVPLTNELTAELKMWAQCRLAMHTEDKAHLFVSLSQIPCNIDGYGLPFTSRQHAMRKWCSKVKVKAFGWHAIRHLSATILYRRGYGQSFIQAILRHKSATTTARYLHSLGSNEVRAAMNDGFKREAQIIAFEPKKMASGGKS